MLLEAHQGVEREFPGNTLISFEAAIRQGYDYVELDLGFTKDKKCVVLHDEAINRTCRNPDGSIIADKINISDITYAEAEKYDAGIYKAEKFKGEKIPLFSQALTLCRNAGVKIKIDNKIQNFTAEQLEILFSLCENSENDVGFTSNNLIFIKMLTERFPKNEIHYDGIVDESSLKGLKGIRKSNKITVWMPIASGRTSRVTVPTANADLCERIRKDFSLGIWICDYPEEFAQAVKFNADIVETSGGIKPELFSEGFFDCHIHSEYSHDSKAKIKDIVQFAESKKIAGVTVCDHCDVEYCNEQDVLTNILHSAKEAKKFGCLTGVEIGEGTWYPECTAQVVKLYDFDQIIGSVHAVKFGEYCLPFSRIDFSEFSDEMTDSYLQAYFNEMLTLVKTGDFDILAHLTCPLRYIIGRFGKSADITRYYDRINEILKIIIQKGIALEVNTSCLGSGYDRLMPDEDILNIYKNLGGYLVTLGSDAHIPEKLAYEFEYAVETLKKIGFENIFYFEKRIPIQYKLKGLKK